MNDSQNDNNNNSGIAQREKAPAFQFYAADWLADERLVSLSLEEQGAYVRILAFAWRAKTVSSDPKVIARLIGCGCTPEVASGAMAMLERCHSDASRCYSPMLEQRRAEQAANRAKKSKSGSLGGKAKSARTKSKTYPPSDATAMLQQCSSDALANSSSSSSSASLDQIQIHTISEKPQTEVPTEAPQLPLTQTQLPSKPAARARKQKDKLTNLVDMTEAELISLGKHPSLQAPRHLTRKKDELISWDAEEQVWLTSKELENLQSKLGFERTENLINILGEYLGIHPDKVQNYADHSLTIQNWHRRNP